MKSIVRMSGGLGNQLFQAAFGDFLYKKHNQKVVFDTSSYFHSERADNDTTQRNFIVNSLYKFGDFKDLGISSIESELQSLLQSKKSKLYLKFHFFLYICRIAYSNRYIFHFNSNMCFLWKIFGDSFTHVFVGNWQDPIYISDSFNEEISKTLSNLLKVQLAHDFSKILGIHIRRGDYLKNNSIHAVLEIEYYKQAVEIGIQGILEPVLIVFTDDIEWCRSNLKFSFPILFANEIVKSDLEELALISKLNHLIIANSSFSLMGALLGKHPKEIIAPKVWFVDGSKPTAPQFPKTWIKL